MKNIYKYTEEYRYVIIYFFFRPAYQVELLDWIPEDSTYSFTGLGVTTRHVSVCRRPG